MTIRNFHSRELGALKKKEVRIHIGDFYTSSQGIVISTILGSCVAVCLHDKHNNIAGMNHIILPGKTNSMVFDQQTRYSINAMEILINAMMKKGANRHNLMAKIFGGAHVLPDIDIKNAVGRQISDFVVRFLETEGIPIMARDLGGERPRKVFFFTDTGNVSVKKISPTSIFRLMREEARKKQIIEQEIRKPGNVTFF
ncbi:MAG: chemotaxis protein CheD [Desulfobacula sp.]|nr:chemotaxis protein CheD [Desulfobacula sp.]